MKQKAEIVPASEQDLAVLAELAEQCFPDPWSENVFRQTMCCCYNRIWCAKVDGKLCGYAAVSRTGDAVNLDDIAVSPAFRRQGHRKTAAGLGARAVPGKRILAGSAGVQRRRHCPV